MDEPQRSDDRRRTLIAALLLGTIWFAAPLAIILADAADQRSAGDQNNYHLRVIEQFASQAPRVDLTNYESTTTPGFHLIFATAHRYLGLDVQAMRILNAALSAGLIMTLFWWIRRRTPPVDAVLLTLPFAASLYVVSSAAWLVPDNLGWWGVLAAMTLAWRPQPARFSNLALICVALLLLVFVRQVHIWVAALLWLSAWLPMSTPSRASGPHLREIIPTDEHRAGRSIQRAGASLLATLPAFALLALFIAIWGGLTPPMFQSGGEGISVTGPNPAVPATALTIVGGVGIFFSGYLFPLHRWRSRKTLAILAAAAAAGFLLAVFPLTDFSRDEGRWSGVYNIVARFPAPGGRSPLIIGGSTLGALVIAAWTLRLPTRDAWLFLGMWIAYIAAQTAGSLAWQRYYEPFALMAMAFAAARLRASERDSESQSPAWAPWPLGALALALAAITVLKYT